jgi:hypothetical protein
VQHPQVAQNYLAGCPDVCRATLGRKKGRKISFLEITKFLVLRFETQKWTELASGTFVNWFVSSDHKYLFCTTGGGLTFAHPLR